MNRDFRIFLLAILSFSFVGCAYSIHEVHVSGFRPYAPIEAGRMVKAEASQFVILGFVSDTNYVDQARQNLMNKCPNGFISGISTRISTDLGFFSWTNRAVMQGLCLTRN